MDVVVTGARGFLGKAVISALNRKGANTVGISRRCIDGYVQVLDYRDTPVGDVLIHLAENANRAQVNQGGLEYEMQAMATLSALLDKDYQRVVYASSAVLYGDADSMPHTTKDDVYVTDTYTSVKRTAELSVIRSKKGVVARLSNVFGLGMSDMNVVSDIIRQIPGKDCVLLNDITPVRDFIWIDDAAECITAMAMGEATGIFNVGSGSGTSIESLAKTALELAWQSDRSVCSKKNTQRTSQIVLDINNTKKVWGWNPETSLSEGLRRLLHPVRKEHE